MDELRALCVEADISKTGTKAKLIDRLMEAPREMIGFEAPAAAPPAASQSPHLTAAVQPAAASSPSVPSAAGSSSHLVDMQPAEGAYDDSDASTPDRSTEVVDDSGSTAAMVSGADTGDTSHPSRMEDDSQQDQVRLPP